MDGIEVNTGRKEGGLALLLEDEDELCADVAPLMMLITNPAIKITPEAITPGTANA